MHVIFYGLFIYFVVYRFIAREDVLVTYLLNILIIIITLFLDNIARRYAKKSEQTIREVLFTEIGSVYVRLSRMLYIFSLVFFRTTMYLFYIIVLILAVVTTQRPNLLPVELNDFFSSIEYGILLLIVFDSIKVLITKDGSWLKMHIGLDLSNEDKDST